MSRNNLNKVHQIFWRFLLYANLSTMQKTQVSRGTYLIPQKCFITRLVWYIFVQIILPHIFNLILSYLSDLGQPSLEIKVRSMNM